MRKIFLIILASLLLSGCFQVVAFVPSVITGVTTGSALQAGVSYGFQHEMHRRTGKTTFQHIIGMAQTTKERTLVIRNEDLISSFAPN